MSTMDHRKPIEESEVQSYFDKVLDELEEYREKQSPGHGKTKILIFIHGGLNLPSSSIKRAACLSNQIIRNQSEGDCKSVDRPMPQPDPDGYFPIFINWRSFFFSTYLEHLVLTRRGMPAPVRGSITALPTFVGDLGRSIARAPIVWEHQFQTAIDTYRGTSSLAPKKDVQSHYCRLKDQVETQLAVSKGPDHGPPGLFGKRDRKPNECEEPADGSWWEGTRNFLTAFVTLPSKIALAPLIDGFGKPSWDMMNRRTEIQRRRAKEFEELKPEDPLFSDYSGVLARFLDRLARMIKDNCAEECEVTLIGHSMGAIVTNWIVADFGGRLSPKNIVYLAAACSISDFERQVIPFLTSEEGSKTKFYNLTLHPRNEARERNLFDNPYLLDFSPRGSLLAWIDNFLSTPENFLDRTLGRWNNIIPAVHIFPKEIHDRVTIKAFGVSKWFNHDSGCNPQKHGQFTDGAFWKDTFWMKPRGGESLCGMPQ